MKNEIDKLVKEICFYLEQPEPKTPELASALNMLGVAGISMAIQLRKTLENYTEDCQLTKEEQLYARAQIDNLPDF